jgi:hypothetical protein
MRHINVRAHSDLLSPFEFEPHEKMRFAPRSVELGRHLLCEKWTINPNVSALWFCSFSSMINDAKMYSKPVPFCLTKLMVVLTDSKDGGPSLGEIRLHIIRDGSFENT